MREVGHFLTYLYFYYIVSFGGWFISTFEIHVSIIFSLMSVVQNKFCLVCLRSDSHRKYLKPRRTRPHFLNIDTREEDNKVL
jgi:hypothetical protein